ncbi:MAG TPA: PepSY-associated TM helix domain-containing protein [Pricia sp.]|nr:PepSY-associated TM helix domain-containing protein [Pricia sp.]
MQQRPYNILFHTHTVSGIVICVALYVIFFTGSFSFFRDEITNWQRDEQPAVIDAIPEDVDGLIATIGKSHVLKHRDIEISRYYNEKRINVNMGAVQDTLVPEEQRGGIFFSLNPEDATEHTYEESYGLGEFLYRLHFLDQIPYPYGRFLAGLVAFFFLFAIITGILVHWDKMVKNFYVFRPWAKLKTVWTDAHTALGVIGFPFQFMYAVTGAFFLLKAIFVFPSVIGLYNGDESKLYDELEYNHPVFPPEGEPLEGKASINPLIQRTKQEWPGFQVQEAHIFNYGDANMHVAISGHLEPSRKLNSSGHVIYRMSDRSVVSSLNPETNDRYLDGVKNLLFRLHFGDFGGTALRVIYFVLGLISCFVILSGILIWVSARDKKNVPDRKRRFYRAVGHWYLAICLSMYPVTALSFILVKAFPDSGRSFLYLIYFIPWGILSALFILKKDNAFTNRQCLLWGGILGLMVPVVNAIFSGNWIGTNLARNFHDAVLVDVLWIVLGLFSLWLVFFKLKKRITPPVA